jgi:hypothetical protein
VKADIFGEPIAANYINYKKKRNFKTCFGGFMSVLSVIIIITYFVFKLKALFQHEAKLDQQQILHDFE